MLVLLMPTAFAADYGVLGYGETGADVTQLQQALYNEGYLGVSPTGYYGHLTEDAVIAFQRDQGLRIDGIAGPATQSALFASSGTVLLKLGSTGTDVTTLQERLHSLGYLDYSGATGYYGGVTRTAVVRFQQQCGLLADGIAGPATQARLYASSAPSLMLRTGNSGEAVGALQTRLAALGYYTYGTATGYYGSITKSAVIQFQQSCGLSADGIAGPATRRALFSGDAPAASADTAAIADIGLAQTGKPYVLGDEGSSSFDCSGLVYYAVNRAGFGVPRYSAAVYSEYTAWTKVYGTSSLQKGDILFFRSDTSASISHTGIYIGGGEFVHASSGQGAVIVSRLDNVYWARNYAFARRVA